MRVRFVAVLMLMVAPVVWGQNFTERPGFQPNGLILAGEGTVVDSQPLIADLGLATGYKQIIFGTTSGELHVLMTTNGTNWSEAPGFPVLLTEGVSTPPHISSSPAIGDIDGNGTPDIVVGFASTFDQGTANGGAKAFNRTGTQLWEVITIDHTPGPPNGKTDPVQSTPAIGDIDGDGTAEVIFGGLDHRIYVVNGENGATNNASFWPYDAKDTVFSSPALHDVDGDGKLDIIIGTDSSDVVDGAGGAFLDGGWLRVLKFNATSAPGFPKFVNEVVSSSPVVGDVDGDGQPEIVHGTGYFWGSPAGGSKPVTRAVYAWNCDGSAQFQFATTGPVITVPALADLEGDGALEVIVTDYDPAPSNKIHYVYAIRGNGTQVFKTEVRDFFNQSLSASHPVVGDILTSSAGLEVMVPSNGEVVVFSSTGTQLTEKDGFNDDPPPNFMTQYSLSNASLGTIENGNPAGDLIELLAVSGQASGVPGVVDIAVHVWNPGALASNAPWPMFKQNPRRLSVFSGTAACGACSVPTTAQQFYTIAPCRLMDTRGGAPVGGPAFTFSGMNRTFQVTGSCGIPSTARAVSANITVVSQGPGGHFTFSPNCQPGAVSNINFRPGGVRANNGVLVLSPAGELRAVAALTSPGTVHLVVDVNGYFQPVQ